MTKRVLLIDDDPVVISLYTTLLKEQGYEVDSAADGEEGFALLGQRRPDVVLLDLSLPRLNGIDWLCVVRADKRFLHLPVVILTASDSQTSAARKSDAICVLPKQGTPPNLVVATVIRSIANTADRAAGS